MVLAVWAVAGCGSHDRTPTVPEYRVTSDTAALNVPVGPIALPLSTYDGSGETVHPDFAAPRSPWKHRLFYLALTPYPAGATYYENPSLYASLDGVRWSGAPRAPMPLVKPRNGHLSDPDLVHASVRGELFLYYRQVSDSDRVFLMRSADGAQWSRSRQLFATKRYASLSPAVVRRAKDDWWMWSVDARSGCNDRTAQVTLRRSTDGIAWSDPAPAELGAPSLLYPWHLDVQWIPERGEFWALYPVKAPETCATTALFLATSRNGVTWRTLPTPVLIAGTIRELSHIVYRSTFSYDARTDMVALWLSGARLEGEGRFRWRTVAFRRPRLALFADLAAAQHRPVPIAPRRVRTAFTPP
jgi:hypothetical protein